MCCAYVCIHVCMCIYLCLYVGVAKSFHYPPPHFIKTCFFLTGITLSDADGCHLSPLKQTHETKQKECLLSFILAGQVYGYRSQVSRDKSKTPSPCFTSLPVTSDGLSGGRRHVNGNDCVWRSKAPARWATDLCRHWQWGYYDVLPGLDRTMTRVWLLIKPLCEVWRKWVFFPKITKVSQRKRKVCDYRDKVWTWETWHFSLSTYDIRVLGLCHVINVGSIGWTSTGRGSHHVTGEGDRLEGR